MNIYDAYSRRGARIRILAKGSPLRSQGSHLLRARRSHPSKATEGIGTASICGKEVLKAVQTYIVTHRHEENNS